MIIVVSVWDKMLEVSCVRVFRCWLGPKKVFVSWRIDAKGLDCVWWWRLFGKPQVNFHVTISVKVQPKIGLKQ